MPHDLCSLLCRRPWVQHNPRKNSIRAAHKSGLQASAFKRSRRPSTIVPYLLLDLGVEHCLDSLLRDLGKEHCLDSRLDSNVLHARPQTAAVEPQANAIGRDCVRQIGHERWLEVLYNLILPGIRLSRVGSVRLQGHPDVSRSPLTNRFADGVALQLVKDRQQGGDLVRKSKQLGTQSLDIAHKPSACLS